MSSSVAVVGIYILKIKEFPNIIYSIKRKPSIGQGDFSHRTIDANVKKIRQAFACRISVERPYRAFSMKDRYADFVTAFIFSQCANSIISFSIFP